MNNSNYATFCASVVAIAIGAILASLATAPRQPAGAPEVLDDASTAGRQQNRRVEVVISPLPHSAGTR